ncbi:hypothetical protein BV25DRAFT_1831071 [Artomyces pyxidatus]|uniref:Uncharacterized protein n=1 Tax=Artomyces pyxidatus TaxID=48021 RepID=A0ACB8SMA3_9AGAM|nr:hypothetical protein BV25DRAFT_1831071 [Artomyces pyxidatus]
MPIQKYRYRFFNPPITDFPQEVLEHIFCHLVEPEPSELTGAPSWIPVTQVCRRWRRIGYGCKALWTTIPLWSRPWTEVALAHSRPLPISLLWDPDDDRQLDTDTLSRALSELPRVRDLTLDLRDQESDTCTLQNLATHSLEASPTPCMETLTLLTTDEFLHLDRLPGTLRALNVKNAVMPLATLHACHALRVLEVESSELWLTLAEMVDALAHLPRLEVLHIGAHVVPHDVREFPAGGRRPRIPLNLRSLQLTGRPSELLRIVRSLAIPPTCSAILEFAVGRASHSEAIAAAAAVEDLFHVDAQGRPPFDWMSMNQSPTQPGVTHFCATSNALPGRSLLMGMSWPLGEDVSGFALTVFPVFRGLRRLTVIDTSFMTEANWIRLSRIMPGLDVLTVRGDHEVYALLSAFGTALHHRHRVFPYLQKLNMPGTAISQPRQGERAANLAVLLQGVRQSRGAVRLCLNFEDATYAL